MSYQVSNPWLPALSHISHQRSSSPFTILTLRFPHLLYFVYYLGRQYTYYLSVTEHVKVPLTFSNALAGTATLLPPVQARRVGRRIFFINAAD
jgi:hypothetical protein